MRLLRRDRTTPRTSPRRHGTIPVAAILLLGIWWLGGHRAAASEESMRLYSRGLVPFHAEQYRQALDLFDAAVKDDPQDPYARYYRGVTRGRLGDFDGAAADLYAALEGKPELTQAMFELGVVLVQAGKYDEAAPWLERAQKVKQLSPRASFFLGIADLRRGRTTAARRNFERAAAEDPELSLSARYYLGVVAYQEGNTREAETQFNFVSTTSPDSTMGHEAAAFLAQMRKGGHANLQLYGNVGMQYDSNVVLAPSDSALKDALAISEESDGRAVITLGGTYVPWRTDRVELSLGYEFFQSLHFQLTEFNIQDHRPNAQISVDMGPVQFGMLGRYDYYFLDTDSFLQEVVAQPWLGVPESTWGRTEVSYRMRRRDFLKQPYSSTSMATQGLAGGGRDAFNHAADIRQLAYLGAPERYVFLGYRYDYDDPVNAAGNAYGYHASEGSGGAGWSFPQAIDAELSYAYRYEHYGSASAQQFPPTGSRRHDGEHEVFAAVSKALNTRFAITAAYLGTFNNSSKPVFDYDRHIVSLALQMRFY